MPKYLKIIKPLKSHQMRSIILKIILKLFNQNIFFEYNKLKKQEYQPIKQNLKIQEEKLKKLLLHAWKNVPYYNKILSESKVVSNGTVNIHNFNQVPILTKDIIREKFSDLQSHDSAYKKRHPYTNTSGGSTGIPIKFIQDNETWKKGMAGKWLFFSFITSKFPCKLIKLWGSERDLLKGSYGITAKIKNWTYHRKVLNSFLMTEKKMREYINKINKYKPTIIEAYVQSIFELSLFAKKNNLNVFSPKGIIISAGTLYPEVKNEIEAVFKTKVFNRYGSREVGDIACSCNKNEGLHLNISQHYLEILNDKLEPCQPGELGKIYITTLDNLSMPLIRYDIGDIGILSENITCSCGRGLPIIKSIKGREVGMIKKENGDIIDGEFFTHLFYYKNWVKQFQVVQTGYQTIEINIVSNKDKNNTDIIEIEASIKHVMGENCIIKWNYMDTIPPLPNGKFLYTISKI